MDIENKRELSWYEIAENRQSLKVEDLVGNYCYYKSKNFNTNWRYGQVKEAQMEGYVHVVHPDGSSQHLKVVNYEFVIVEPQTNTNPIIPVLANHLFTVVGLNVSAVTLLSIDKKDLMLELDLNHFCSLSNMTVDDIVVDNCYPISIPVDSNNDDYMKRKKEGNLYVLDYYAY